MYWSNHKGFAESAKDFISVVVSAGLAIYALWPMVALMMSWRMPSVYYIRLIVWAFLGTLVVTSYYVMGDGTTKTTGKP